MRFPLSCHLILLPKIGFIEPKFTFGDIVRNPKTGVWGAVIGMSYTPAELGNGKAIWFYEIRLSPRSCSASHFNTMEGRESFNENELEKYSALVCS